MRRFLLAALVIMAMGWLVSLLVQRPAEQPELPLPGVDQPDPSGPGAPLMRTHPQERAAWRAEAPEREAERAAPRAAGGEGPRMAEPAPGASAVKRGTGRASISGVANVPAHLRPRMRDMHMYVTCTEDLGPGMSSETWTRPGVLDARGAYRLERLPSGRYFLQLVLDGRAVSEPHRLDVAAGERVEDKDFDFDRTPSAEGRVFSATTAKPVPGARVEVADGPPVDADADGRFILYDLPAGRYALLVRHPDHAPGRLSLAVTTQGPLPQVELALKPGAEVRVTALGLDGKVVPRLFVTLCAKDHMAAAYTDQHGVARIRGLEPDARYTIRLPGIGAGAPPVTLVPDAEIVREVRLTWEP